MRGAISYQPYITKQKECCFSLTHFLECDEERESGLGWTHKHYSLKISSKSSTLYNSTPQVNPTTFVMIIDGHPKKNTKRKKQNHQIHLFVSIS